MEVECTSEVASTLGRSVEERTSLVAGKERMSGEWKSNERKMVVVRRSSASK